MIVRRLQGEGEGKLWKVQEAISQLPGDTGHGELDKDESRRGKLTLASPCPGPTGRGLTEVGKPPRPHTPEKDA